MSYIESCQTVINSPDATKAKFMILYSKNLFELRDWAKDPVKLQNFMVSVGRTVYQNKNTWNFDKTTNALKKTWKDLGFCQSTLSLKNLRNLPNGSLPPVEN